MTDLAQRRQEINDAARVISEAARFTAKDIAEAFARFGLAIRIVYSRTKIRNRLVARELGLRTPRRRRQAEKNYSRWLDGGRKGGSRCRRG